MESTLAWGVFLSYVVVTTGLAVMGMRKTKSLSGFALGNGDMGPLMVGITLAAATASTATFLINPGFVWAHGLSALLHYGVAGAGGVAVGLVVLSKGFRRLGKEHTALTLPHWIGARFQNGGLRTYFALLNLVLAITFVVLIVKGSALIMQLTLGLSYDVGVVVVVGFVFSYIFLGGTYAHAYTNTLQGALMIVVALLIAGSGADLLFDKGISGIGADLYAQSPALASPYNADGGLYDSFFSVFVTGFIVSFGLVCQPHILMKALYLKSDRDVNRYLVIGAGIGFVFALMLLAGIYARVRFPELAAEGIGQDAVMVVYIQRAFPTVVGVLISVAILAAGMSTMDGILVSASTIAGNDLFLGALGKQLTKGRTDNERQRLALHASRGILIAMGVASLILALDPPEVVGLFAQLGIYGLVTASIGPVVFGVFVARSDARVAWLGAVVGPVVHFAHYGYVSWTSDAYFNPAVSATEGVVASLLVMAAATALVRTPAKEPKAQNGAFLA